ncbi:phytase [Brevundimonas vitis]|uniref:Phytase n=1 Tax=Brevundimonas vitisensis TaxID=2800818 RepID=A0ABX7BN20_9CAUL|nr:phytase [Brevundimonas vitisensis]QQQ18984.1 phytase [Brevundimonas vitisensis]
MTSPLARRLSAGAALAWGLTMVSGCASAQDAVDTSATVAARRATEATATGQIASTTLVLDGQGGHILSAAGLGGLEVYGLDGTRLGQVAAGEAVGLDVGYGFMLAGQPTTVVAAVDISQNTLRLFRMDGTVLTEVGARAIPLGFAAENVCLFHNSLDGALYAFVVGDGGEIDQQLIYADANGRLDARQVRRLNVISTVKQCVVDSAASTVYASEETVGIWRFTADPEAFAAPVLIDSPRFGALTEEVGGLALYDGGEGARWLLASDASAGRINVYDRTKDDAYVRSVLVSGPDGGDVLGEPGPMAATSRPMPGFANGLILVTDEDGANVKVVSFADLASPLGLAAGAPTDPRVHNDSPVPTVTATVETAAVASFGDAADDPAIWAHPTDPAQSLIVATDKKGGLFLYDMQGHVVQDLRDGKMNNVDLREGFNLNGERVVLVTASDRTNRSIAIYRLDTASRRLIAVADGVQDTGLADPYGLCMYRELATDRTYVFINGDDTRLRQWELVDAGNGKVRANFVRELTFGSQTEGCVADDDNGVLYVAEEDIGLWRMSAHADGGTDMAMVQAIADNPAVKDDYEGVGLYDLGNGRGYVVVSSQGNDTYAVYRREAPQEYLGSFAVAADPLRGIDGISETDGLEVTSRNLGPGFEQGAMVAQDGRNVLPVENQNYKYVPWSAIAEALDLETR